MPITAVNTSSPPAPAAAAMPVAAPAPALRQRRDISGRMVWTGLAVITLIAAFFRLWRLGHQGYWCDETATIGRISGNMQHLVDSLRDQAFPPGWYALLHAWTALTTWAFGSEAAAYRPEVLRFVPAFIGIFIGPVMYFLARQFTDRRGALLVALLAAVNPYLVYYSRDLKMYGPTYLFVALHVACFLRWQLTHRHWLWFPLATLTGAIMVSLHGMTLFILPLELIYLLARRNLKSLDGPLWIVSLGLIAVVPVWWYTAHTEWMARAADTGKLGGLEWNTLYTQMEPRTVAGLPVVHLFGFLWPHWPLDHQLIAWFGLGDNFLQHTATRTLPWLARGELWASWGLLALLVVGILPWRKMPYRALWRDARTSVTPLKRHGWRLPLLPVTAVRSAWHHWPPKPQGRAPWWYVALWIVVPTGVLLLTWLPRGSPWYHRIWGTHTITEIWEPRYLGIIVPAWILWLSAALRRLPTWPVRTLAISAVVAICVISSLSNELIYRQAPWGHIADVYAQYAQADGGAASVALVVPQTRWTGDADLMQVRVDLGEDPNGGQGNSKIPGRNVRRGVSDRGLPAAARGFGRSKTLQTIILVDRLGDENDGPVGAEEIQKALGNDWRLTHTETFGWYYEWRYYFRNIWRLRVYERAAPAPRTAAATKRK